MNLYRQLLYSYFSFARQCGQGVDGYHCAETAIVQDMNQALSKTLAQKREAWITPDTIENYRQHLQIAALRRRSVVSYALGEDAHSLCSRQMKWRSGSRSLRVQSYADCSFATVWGLVRPAVCRFSF